MTGQCPCCGTDQNVLWALAKASDPVTVTIASGSVSDLARRVRDEIEMNRRRRGD